MSCGESIVFYNAREQKLKLDDMHLDYITFGSGRKTLIMIQGLNTRSIKGAHISLAYMYRKFAKDYTVYLFDRRPVVYEGITVKDFAADIAAAMDALGLSKADVFGVSQGGMIAQHLALDRPDLVNKLVLAVTASRNNETMESVIDRWIELTEAGDVKALVIDMAEKMYSDSYVRRYKPFMGLLAILQRPKDVSRFIILAKSCLTCDSYDNLERIKCPVLVLGGKDDKVVGSEASVEIASKLGCDIYLYEHLGHAAYEEARDFNSRVYSFLMS